jgi:hypothetical protein
VLSNDQQVGHAWVATLEASVNSYHRLKELKALLTAKVEKADAAAAKQ